MAIFVTFKRSSRLQSRRPHRLSIIRCGASPTVAGRAASEQLMRDADTVNFDGDDVPTADLAASDLPAGRAAPPDRDIEQEASVPLTYSWENPDSSNAASPKDRPVPTGALRPTELEPLSRSATRSPQPGSKPDGEPAADQPAAHHDTHPSCPGHKSDVPAIQPDVTTGSLLRKRYAIEHVVGIGGNSVVFQAVDRHRDSVEEQGERVAVKVLRPELRSNPHALRRLQREFRQMQRLTHNGIARVFDLDCDGDIWFMTLELIQGQTITHWMKGSAPDAEAMQIITGCCEAVSYAHSRGIVHGDLKPSNVLVTPTRGIKLVDFGSAAAELTGAAVALSARSLAATPPYASPQILTGTPADPRDDVFSLACIAYAVLTRGAHPFERKSSLDAYREQMRPAYSPKIQPRVFDVIVRALSWQRTHRHASATEFLNALIGSDLRRDAVSNGNCSRESATQFPVLTIPITTTPATAPRDGICAIAAQYPMSPGPMSPGAIHSLPATLDIPPSQRYLPAQWLAFQPWTDDVRRAHVPVEAHQGRSEAPHWLGASLAISGVPLVPAVRPVPTVIDGELLARSSSIMKRDKHVEPPPTIWHRHGLAAVAILGVFAILLGHESDVGSSTATQVKATLPAPVTTIAAVTPVAIRETTEHPEDALVQPNIVEHVVPPPPIPAAPGFVSFDTATVHVGSGQSMAVLTVKRLDSTQGRARVGWAVEGASAQAVIDNSAIDSQTIQFLDGQAVRSLYIPLLTPSDPGDHQPTRSFIVKLKKLEGSPAVGPVTQTKVSIASGY